MQSFKFLPALFISIIFLVQCNSDTSRRSIESYGEFQYLPLDDFKHDTAIIKPGTEVEILANLGGRPNNGDTVFYYQFIVKNKVTGDTVRILCPEITIDQSAGIDHRTSTSPLSFNFSKGVTNAFYELTDTTQSLLLNGENLDKMIKETDSADINHLLDPGNAKKFAVLDKNAPAIENSTFRTAIGILNFKKIPW